MGENGHYDLLVVSSVCKGCKREVAGLGAEDFLKTGVWPSALFTARGVPVVYYGSETGFMRGRAEHAGNRNYFGQERIDAASKHRASSPVIPRFAAWPAAQRTAEG